MSSSLSERKTARLALVSSQLRRNVSNTIDYPFTVTAWPEAYRLRK
jgi:hypothetical protein